MLRSYPERLRGAARCCSGKTSAKRPVEALIGAQERSSRTTLRPLPREPALNLRAPKAVMPADLEGGQRSGAALAWLPLGQSLALRKASGRPSRFGRVGQRWYRLFDGKSPMCPEGSMAASGGTVGVEEELLLVEPRSYRLAHGTAEHIVESGRWSAGDASTEVCDSSLELISPIAGDAAEA